MLLTLFACVRVLVNDCVTTVIFGSKDSKLQYAQHFGEHAQRRPRGIRMHRVEGSKAGQRVICDGQRGFCHTADVGFFRLRVFRASLTIGQAVRMDRSVPAVGIYEAQRTKALYIDALGVNNSTVLQRTIGASGALP